jgi:signal transduction histidine kinase
VTDDVRDYSRGLVSGPAWDQFVAVGRSILEGTVAVMGAKEGSLWIPPRYLSGPPLATCPERLSPRRIRAARLAAQRAASGQGLTGDQMAVVVTGDGPSPQAVFVLARDPDAPFSTADRRLLARLAPLLAVAASAAMTAQDQTDMTRAVDPSRATLDLLASLAHEMRTPLAAIKGYATALLNAPGEWDRTKVQEALQVIDQETSTMTTLISELLEAATIDGGRLTLQLEPVLLNRLLERLVADFARQTAIHRFEASFPPKWPAIPGDPHRLEQVFRNILDNAVKYSPHGGRITVKGTASPGEVVVSIADQGIGIAPADLNRLFEKFFRARRSLRVAGSGLGLPIAHAIVEQHGGRIWAESTLGQGTTLHVALPRRGRGGTPAR